MEKEFMIDKDFDHLLELFPRPMSPCSYKGDLSFSLEHIKQEYPVYGSGDLRHPAIDILQENGSHILNFEYVSHEIIQGKPKLKESSCLPYVRKLKTKAPNYLST